jgi:hypothetical protein
MSWQQISVGVPIDDLETSFHLEVEPLRDIFLISGHHLKGKTLGGTFESSDYKYDVINRNGHITLTVAELELNQILALEREDFVSSGRLSGSVPVQIQEGNLSVNKGWISAISPGGRLRYSPGLSVVELAKQNKSLKVVLDAMSDFHYHTLDVELEYSKEGQLIAKTGLKGRNPAYDNGREVHLNLNLVEKNVGALLESLRLTDNVARKIESKTNSGVF